VADVPVAIFLSAGIDSGALTALGAGLGKCGHPTVTVGFQEYIGRPPTRCRWRRSAPSGTPRANTTSIVTREDFQGRMGRFLESMDQPTLDGFNTYCASQAAAEIG